MSKRARCEVMDPKELRFAYLLGIDNLYQPVRADLALLRHYGCRTQKSIDNGDVPAYMETDDVPVYNSWMTRAMIVCFLKSMTIGKLSIDSTVTYSDACSMFDYEGICVPSADDAEQYHKLSYSIGVPSMGIGMNKRSESIMDSMSRLAETIACAILEWPRLDHGLESSFAADEDATETAPVAFTCTPTRCWVKFLQAPKTLVEVSSDPTYTLCKRRPFWLLATLYAIGSVHCRLIALGKLRKEDRGEAAFFALEEGIKHDPSYHFVSTRVDVPRAWRERSKRTLGDAERFAIMVLNEVTSHGELKESDKVNNACKFARACVALALKMVTNTPRIATMFSAGCEDEKGTTPERVALSKALKIQGIKVIKWGSDDNALVFPPSFRGIDPKGDGPCVLLGFENMR